jgi:hypothetical protein
MIHIIHRLSESVPGYLRATGLEPQAAGLEIMPVACSLKPVALDKHSTIFY